MFAKSIALLLAAGALVSATGFTIPKDAGDGLYSIDATTGEVTKIEHLSPAAEPQVNGFSAKFKRAPFPDGTDGCAYQGENLNATDIANAQSALATYCGTGASVPNGNHLAYTSGNVAAYVCNYGGANSCASQEVNAAFALIQGDCQSYAGWYFIRDWQKTYGYQAVPHTICANGA